MKKPILGILCGGFSSEKEISFKSGINVMKNLSEKLWDSHLIKINNNEWYVEDKEENKYNFFINDFAFKKNNLKIKFDIIFNSVHGAPGENGQIISFLEPLNLNLILEPGRSISGNAGVLLSKVEYLKTTSDMNFAVMPPFLLSKFNSQIQ